MTRPTNFLTTYLGVVMATLFFVMSVAFVSVPYAMKAHPGEPMSKPPVTSSYHQT
jgi:hypothetical protein